MLLRRPTAWAVRCASSHSLGVDLVGAQHGADLVVEDLCGGAGQRAEAGVLEPGQVRRQRLAQPLGALGHLESREAVDVDAGHGGLHRPHHVDVEVAVEGRVDAALEAHLGRAPRGRLGGALGDVVEGEQVGRSAQVQRQRALGEPAERAPEGADVGVVDVAVDDVGDVSPTASRRSSSASSATAATSGPRAENRVTSSASPSSWPARTPASTSPTRPTRFVMPFAAGPAGSQTNRC